MSITRCLFFLLKSALLVAVIAVKDDPFATIQTDDNGAGYEFIEGENFRRAGFGPGPFFPNRIWGALHRWKKPQETRGTTPDITPAKSAEAAEQSRSAHLTAISEELPPGQERINPLSPGAKEQTAWSSLNYVRNVRFPEPRLILLFILGLTFMVSLGWIRKRGDMMQGPGERSSFPEV